MAVPTCYGSTAAAPCARIDMFKEYVGLDLQKMYPGPDATPDQELIDNWTWETFLTAAEKCAKGGHPFGLGVSTCTGSVIVAGGGLTAHRRERVAVKWSLVDQDGTLR